MGLQSLPETHLTKSDFLNYRTCPGYAWLKRHQPHLLPELDDEARRRIRQGIEVDQLARTRYADGVLIEPLDMASAIAETVAHLGRPETTILFQATLWAEPGNLARADVLIRDGDDWRLIEVKSACEVKDEHLVDAAFQVATFESAGLTISSVAILHLDGSYRRSGACDPHLLFAESDCTDGVRALIVGIRAEMAIAALAIANATQTPPCECHRKTKSNHCPSFAQFHPNVPKKGSIYELSRIHASKLEIAANRGVRALSDWPDDLRLSPSQQRQLDIHRAGTEWVDHAGLDAFLAQLEFPLYFLDYEACAVPVPMFEGCRPYQQVPFQYSLHVVERDGKLTHFEYLSTEIGSSPVDPLGDRLAAQIGPVGSVVVWHALFERGRNAELAESLPQLATFFLSLNERMVDLKLAVTQGLYVHPGFGGSASIKSVLPVIAPDLSYTALTISDGGTASDQWRVCQMGESSELEREALFSALREYCHLDTLAMVRIWQHLSDLCAEEQVA